MKIIFKITVILIISILILGQMNFVQAEEIDQSFWRPKVQGGEKFQIKAKIIVGVIRNIGIVVSVMALMIIGIREMTASAEEKSIYKEAMPGYILGAVLVMGITILPSIIYSIVNEWNK